MDHSTLPWEPHFYTFTMDTKLTEVDGVGPMTNRVTTLLMDNVAFHRSVATRYKMHQKGFTPLYTPPYSPKTNPIENVFGIVKTRFRKLCPVHVDASVDYVDIMEAVLAEPLDLTPLFHRAERFIQETVRTGAVGFKGYDV